MTPEQLKHYKKAGRFTAIYDPKIREDLLDVNVPFIGKNIDVYPDDTSTIGSGTYEPISYPPYKGQYSFLSNIILGWIPEEDLNDLTIVDEGNVTPEYTALNGNILIAQFLEFVKETNEESFLYGSWSSSDNELFAWEDEFLLFDKSWDRLMLAVHKMRNVGVTGGVFYDLRDALLNADIVAAWNEVVEFIHWYNERRNNKRESTHC